VSSIAAELRQRAEQPLFARCAFRPGTAAPLDEVLRPYLSRFVLPALAAAVVRNGQFTAAGAVGTRRAGTDTPVAIGGRFHIGSNTKAMTSLLAGILVEQGLLRWDSTVGELFPELAAGMAASLPAVTLEQLLSHTGGVPSDNYAFRQLLVESSAKAD
jgi:CubicO group peptidase (beta-lactamase class C family)